MFLATMLAVFPKLETPMQQDLQAAGLLEHVSLTLTQIRKNGLAAAQVQVKTKSSETPTQGWREIREFLTRGKLDDDVKSAAICIFRHLAEAEAICHSVPVEQVHFHEVADWDSLADIVAAASLITRSGVSGWSVGDLPIGKGVIETAHGKIPVPAPATAELLRGFRVFQDETTGERITPTGAAILKYLIPLPMDQMPKGNIVRLGTGAGQRDFQYIANILRAILIQTQSPGTNGDFVSKLEFEIDDMTPEEISVATDHIRTQVGVLDVGYTVGYGKKGRIRYCVQVLSNPAFEKAVIRQCFDETSTIGMRVGQAKRHVLEREQQCDDETGSKTVIRPSGTTTKVDSDDLTRISTLHARREMARKVVGNETN